MRWRVYAFQSFTVHVFILFALYAAQFPSAVVAQVEEMVDYFPLAIGNQWLYHFQHEKIIDNDPGLSTTSDSGTSLLTVVAKEEFQDSTVWTMSEVLNSEKSRLGSSVDRQLFIGILSFTIRRRL